ncbi:MAG: zinc finger Ran-binding domain-containing protein [Blastocatellia bacterium]
MSRDFMTNDINKRVGGIPVTSEQIAFKPEQLIGCSKCGKSNPPNRSACFYCGSELDLPQGMELKAKFNLRSLESWEKGYNVIVFPSAQSHIDATAIASKLSIDKEFVQLALSGRRPVPMVRAESEKQAGTIVEYLSATGIEAKVVSDEALSPASSPVRLRSIRFTGESLELTLFNTNKKVEARANELSLIVTGSIFESRRDSVEKRKKGKSAVLDETEIDSDEPVIDIYSGSDSDGWRISTTGFDFSCLGDEKGLVASENMRMLVVRLKEFTINARLIDDYLEFRSVLDKAWPLIERKDSLGLIRHGFGKLELSNSAHSSNLDQFNRYSRLQWHLK